MEHSFFHFSYGKIGFNTCYPSHYCFLLGSTSHHGRISIISIFQGRAARRGLGDGVGVKDRPKDPDESLFGREERVELMLGGEG